MSHYYYYYWIQYETQCWPTFVGNIAPFSVVLYCDRCCIVSHSVKNINDENAVADDDDDDVDFLLRIHC